MKHNIKAKLWELGVRQQIGSQQVQGLIDSESDDEFEKEYDISQNWKRMDSEEGGPMHVFVTWFHRHKYSVIKKTMVKSICQNAGLGDPPTWFTTNASENINSLVKDRME